MQMELALILLVSLLPVTQSLVTSKGSLPHATSPPSTWNEVEPLASALTGTEDASSVQGILGSTPIGTDAAAEAVSDSIRSLFGLPRQRLPLLVPMPATTVPVVADQVMSAITEAMPASAALGGPVKQPVVLVAKGVMKAPAATVAAQKCSISDTEGGGEPVRDISGCQEHPFSTKGDAEATRSNRGSQESSISGGKGGSEATCSTNVDQKCSS